MNINKIINLQTFEPLPDFFPAPLEKDAINWSESFLTMATQE